jgi:hypothetical protein
MCVLTFSQIRLHSFSFEKESGMDFGTVPVTVCRLRKRYRALLTWEIEKTLSEPYLVEVKMRALFGAFS